MKKSIKLTLGILGITLVSFTLISLKFVFNKKVNKVDQNITGNSDQDVGQVMGPNVQNQIIQEQNNYASNTIPTCVSGTVGMLNDNSTVNFGPGGELNTNGLDYGMVNCNGAEFNASNSMKFNIKK